MTEQLASLSTCTIAEPEVFASHQTGRRPEQDGRQPGKIEQIEGMIGSAIDRLTADLESGKSESLRVYLSAMATFHHYSFRNQLLIALQNPRATCVAGFHAWRKRNRFVKKGEKGLVVLAPIVCAVGMTELARDGSSQFREVRRVVNVKPVYVFDVSQTDGEPLPDLSPVSGDPANHLGRLKALFAAKNVSLSYAYHLSGALGCSEGGRVAILRDLAPATEFAVLVHELAHELLHKGERRSSTTRTIRETEAEAVAYVVCRAIGLESATRSSDYIQLYRGDVETFSASLSLIRNISAEIISAILQNGEEVED